MFRIPSVAYDKFFKIYQPKRIINSITTPELNFSTSALETVPVLSNLSIRSLKAQQELYRKQVVDFNAKAKELNTAANQLTANNFFDQKSVTSANSALTGYAKPTAKTTQYYVNVTQVATAQTNDSSTVVSSASGALSSGIYALGFTFGTGTKKTVTVSLSKTDNNTGILGRFAKAINEAQIGVKAEVKTSGTQSYLSLDSEQTGQANSFSIHDIVGNAAQALNINNKVANAQDALYAVNGKNMTSNQNKITLNDGNVILDIHTVSNGSTKISVGMDTDKMSKGIDMFVNTYNKFSDQLADASNVTRRSKKTLAGIEAILTGIREKDFREIGITLNKSDDHLTIDDEKLNKALQQNTDKVAALLSDKTGLGTMAKAISTNALSNPVSLYLKEPNLLDSINYGWLRSGTSFLYNGFNSTNYGLFVDQMI